jgi:hypothetical protein
MGYANGHTGSSLSREVEEEEHGKVDAVMLRTRQVSGTYFVSWYCVIDN